MFKRLSSFHLAGFAAVAISALLILALSPSNSAISAGTIDRASGDASGINTSMRIPPMDASHLLAPTLSGAQKVVVIRVIAADDAGQTPRYTQAQVQSIFDNQMNTLWQNVSYGNIGITATVTALYTMPKNRSAYVGTGGSSVGDLGTALNDAVAAAGSAVNYTGVKAVLALLAMPPSASSFFFRGVENSIMLPIGPSGSLIKIPAALFAENRSEGEPYVWGRWAHEIGHAFQAGGPAHPSNYNNEFDLMDRLLPGQSGMFEKYISGGFPGWMPPAKYTSILIPPPGSACGGTAFIAAEELAPGSVVENQGLVIQVTGGLYYMVSVRKQINGDELYPIPDQGVLIERVIVGADPWVTVQGKGGNRDVLWKNGDTFNSPENIFISVASTVDPNVFLINVTCQSANQPDAFLTPWLTPPLHTYETTDIWVDSLCNGYGVFQYGTYVPSGDSTPVGNGNGDNPCSNHPNRVYARIRNIGTQSANSVAVHFDVTDPMGVGMAGASGWVNIGNVTQVDFPGLSSIPPNGYTDVFITWTPTIASPPAGDFDFHTCIRVRIDPVTSASTEFNTANNIAQENFDHFYTPPAPGGSGAPINRVIHIFNDSAVITKTFSLIWDSDLPPGWGLDVNGNNPNVVLPPGAVQNLPVVVTPNGPRKIGDIYHINVAANSARLLVNSLNAADTHYDAALLGGVSFEVRVDTLTSLQIRPLRGPNGISVSGQLSPLNTPGGPGQPIMLDLLDGQGKIIISQLITTDGTGNFMANFGSDSHAFFVAANFMGDLNLMGVAARSPISPIFLPFISK